MRSARELVVLDATLDLITALRQVTRSYSVSEVPGIGIRDQNRWTAVENKASETFLFSEESERHGHFFEMMSKFVLTVRHSMFEDSYSPAEACTTAVLLPMPSDDRLNV
jgi:hypothetical protein